MNKLRAKRRLINMALCLLGFSLVFVGGTFSSNTQIEKIAEYATEVVTKHTNKKQLCAITVEKTNDSGPILDTSSEFNNLYGTFKQQKITFASMMNVDRRHEINFLYDGAKNLSLLYCGSVKTIEYNGHYKHHMLPIETMFPDGYAYDVSRYIAYISQSHANSILESRGTPKTNGNSYGLLDYESLLNTIVPVSVDGEVSEFAIQNIYYETNYYYEGVNEVAGDFVMVSYYLPKNLRNEQVNLYFLSDYTYQNKYFMNYVNEAYSSKNYLVGISYFNIIDKIDSNYLLSFYYSKTISNTNWLSPLFIAIGGLLVFFSLFLLCLSFIGQKQKPNIIDNTISLFTLFIPYLFFSILYKLTGNISFLSEISSKTNVFFILAYIVCLIIINLIFGNRVHRIKKMGFGDRYCEINI